MPLGSYPTLSKAAVSLVALELTFPSLWLGSARIFASLLHHRDLSSDLPAHAVLVLQRTALGAPIALGSPTVHKIRLLNSAMPPLATPFIVIRNNAPARLASTSGSFIMTLPRKVST